MIPNAEHIFQSKSLDDLKSVNWWWRLEPAQIAVMTTQPVEMGDIPKTPGWWTFHDFLVVNMMQNEQWPAPSLNHCYFVYECSGEYRNIRKTNGLNTSDVHPPSQNNGLTWINHHYYPPFNGHLVYINYINHQNVRLPSSLDPTVGSPGHDCRHGLVGTNPRCWWKPRKGQEISGLWNGQMIHSHISGCMWGYTSQSIGDDIWWCGLWVNLLIDDGKSYQLTSIINERHFGFWTLLTWLPFTHWITQLVGHLVLGSRSPWWLLAGLKLRWAAFSEAKPSFFTQGWWFSSSKRQTHILCWKPRHSS